MSNVYPARPEAVDAAYETVTRAVLESGAARTRALGMAALYLDRVRSAGYGSTSLMEARLGLWAELRRSVVSVRGRGRGAYLAPLVAAYNAVQAGRSRWCLRVGQRGRILTSDLRRVVYDGNGKPRLGERVDRRRLCAVAGYRAEPPEDTAAPPET